MDISEIRKQNLLKLIQDLMNGSQKNFAQIVGTSPAYLSQIINGTIGRNGKPATVGTALARKIEKSLGLPHGAMDQIKILPRVEDPETMNYYDQNFAWDHDPETGEPFSIPMTQAKRKGGIPVISWVMAKTFTENDCEIDEQQVVEWISRNADCVKNTYALKVKGLSMAPRFEPEDHIYVNPNVHSLELKTDDFVIISCDGDSEASFKKLIIEGNDRYLQSINPNWPNQITKLTDDCKIVGKVVALYREI